MSDQPRGSGFATLALHAGHPSDWPAEARGPFADKVADLDVPVFDNGHGCAEAPACAVLEERMAALEGGTAALAVGSGAAAILVSLHTLLQPGDALVVPRRLRFASIRQFEHGFRSFDWQVAWAEADKPESFVEALSDRTKAIFIESIGPGGEVHDIESIASIARRARVPLIVDNTLATPYLLRPFEHGADIVVHAAPAFLGGPACAEGGLVVDGGTFDWVGATRYPSLSQPQPGHDDVVFADMFGNFAFATACRALGLRALGPLLPPANARLILDGIETLALRMRRQCDSAFAVAQHLSRHRAVAWVRYAGLDGDPCQAFGRRYFRKGAGALLTLGLGGGHAAAFVGRLGLFSTGDEVHGTRSLVLAAPKAHRGGGPESETLRLLIGLEDTADIIADLDHALGS